MKKAILSFDVDGGWIKDGNFNIKVESSKGRDIVLERGIPRVLELLRKYDIKGSFFVIGNCVEKYPELHKEIKKMGNEIGSHTYSHPVPMDKLGFKEKEMEIKKNHKVIKNILKVEAKGFRTPAYRVDNDIIDILEGNNYEYDSSVVPTYFPGHFKIKNLLAPKRPYFVGKNYLKKGNRKIVEVPLPSVGFFPLLGTVVTNFGMNYFKFFEKIIQDRPIVLNFHMRDLVDIERNAFWIRSLEKREKVINEVISYLNKKTEFSTIKGFVEEFKNAN